MIKIKNVSIQACSLLFLLYGLCVKAQEKREIYAFSYFKGNGEDGLRWNALKGDSSFLKPKLSKDSLMRDPCIIRGGDGRFHAVWTVSWTDRGIGYASSKDLIHWSEQQYIPVMAHEPGARNCWAPEITYDPKSETYMIYWATTIRGKFEETQVAGDDGYNHRMYYVTTKDFKEYSPAKLLYEPGFNVIDAHIRKNGEQWLMFLKDETKDPVAQKNLKIAFSKELTGPYSQASAPITGQYWAEGPTATKINGKWVVYFDRYTDHRYGAIQSEDLQHWEDITDQIALPRGIRHGTIFKITKKELRNIID